MHRLCSAWPRTSARAHRPSPRDIALGRSLPQEVVGLCTSEKSSPSTSSAPMSPKSLYDDDNATSSLDDEFLSYQSLTPPPPLEPSALRPRGPARPIRRHSSPAERSPSRAPDGGLRFFDGPTDDRPTTDAPPPRDEDEGMCGWRPSPRLGSS
jgi:hypothetical protein